MLLQMRDARWCRVVTRCATMSVTYGAIHHHGPVNRNGPVHGAVHRHGNGDGLLNHAVDRAVDWGGHWDGNRAVNVFCDLDGLGHGHWHGHWAVHLLLHWAVNVLGHLDWAVDVLLDRAVDVLGDFRPGDGDRDGNLDLIRDGLLNSDGPGWCWGRGGGLENHSKKQLSQRDAGVCGSSMRNTCWCLLDAG